MKRPKSGAKKTEKKVVEKKEATIEKEEAAPEETEIVEEKEEEVAEEEVQGFILPEEELEYIYLNTHYSEEAILGWYR